jgi:serralysin
MVADIAALQATYGADPETRAGDTIYTWAPNTPFLEAVYDASGVDTFDLSSHLRPSYVDLTPGSYSSIGIWTAAEQQAFFKSAYPSLDIDGWFQPDSQLYTYEHNLGLAFSTVVEDVLAGSGADTVIGNAAANLVSGGAGADAIFGDAGNDSLTGGQGADFLRGGDGDDSMSGGADFDNMQGNAGRDTLEGGDGDDWVLGGKDNDSLAGQAGADVINGNLGDDVGVGGEGDDVVRGGQGDDDLQGGGGNDLLFGDRGNDTLTGGAGADTFHFDGNGGHDRVTDFNLSAGDQVEIDDGANYTVTQVGGDTVVELASGAQLTLDGNQQSSLQGAWIVVA